MGKRTYSQEEILLKFVQGEDGKAWASDRTGWKVKTIGLGACKWDGIKCMGNQIIGIELNGTDLVATLPYELGQLSSLQSLHLQKNIIHGFIPASLAKLSFLEELDLSNNKLSGPLPLFASKKLKYLHLEYNGLSGEIHPYFANELTSMEDLNIMKNQLSGTLPASLVEMSSLNKLTLSENRIYGTIPENLGKLNSLEFLYLDNNKLIGTIPRSLISYNSLLSEVWLQLNDLSGTVPQSFADLDNLENLYVDGNKLTGTVPKALCTDTMNEDFFDDKYAGDEFPDGGDGIDTDGERCDSIACPVDFSAFEGMWPCQPCPKGTYSPYLGRENGCISLEPEAILHMLYDATEGSRWVGKDNWVGGDDEQQTNWFSTGVQHCDFSGVTCNPNGEIISISLPNYNLLGTIPGELGFLPELRELDLSDNFLEGNIPSDLRFSSLKTLNLNGNQLTGIIPPMLCLEPDINGNGHGGVFECDNIICPVGFYKSDSMCVRCYDNSRFLGRLSCDKIHPFGFVPRSTTNNGAEAVTGIIVFIFAFLVAGAIFTYMRNSSEKLRGHDVPEDMQNKMPPPADPLMRGTFGGADNVIEIVDETSVKSSKKKKKKKKKKDGSTKKKKSVAPSYDQVATATPEKAQQEEIFKISEEDDEYNQVGQETDNLWLDVPRVELPKKDPLMELPDIT